LKDDEAKHDKATASSSLAQEDYDEEGKSETKEEKDEANQR